MPKATREVCPACGRAKPGPKRDAAVEQRAIKLARQGLTIRDIAAQINVSKSKVGRILLEARRA